MFIQQVLRQISGQSILTGRGQRQSTLASCQPRPRHSMLHLEQIICNRAVGWLLQEKLTINQPGDEYEQEADQVAEQVSSSQKQVVAPVTYVAPRSSMIQRDLALGPPPDVAAQPDLTEAQIQDASAFNRRRYSEDSIRQSQDVDDAQVTVALDAETTRLITPLPEYFRLKKDGNAESDTFDLIDLELIAEWEETESCLTSFRITSPHIPWT
jgi:hypothetical protein